MKLTNDGGPAFPTATDDGMSLRDYFAAAALTGYLAAHAGEGQPMPDPADAAEEAVEYADALLARLRTTVARTEAPTA